MQTTDAIKQLYDYNVWANAAFLNYFQAAARADETAIRVFAHLLLAEKIWLERIREENSDNTGNDFWAGETIQECAALFEENRADFDEFFRHLNEEKLDADFAYKNSKGAAFRNTRREALTHLFLHSVYHRGQAAQAIRRQGDAPPATDYIQFLRR